jgi:hypothetical protein
MIIQAPTNVVVVCVSSITPPTVGMFGLLYCSKNVGKLAIFKELSKPLTFVRQEAAALLIRLPIFKVGFRVAGVPIRAHYESLIIAA